MNLQSTLYLAQKRFHCDKFAQLVELVLRLTLLVAVVVLEVLDLSGLESETNWDRELSLRSL